MTWLEVFAGIATAVYALPIIMFCTLFSFVGIGAAIIMGHDAWLRRRGRKT